MSPRAVTPWKHGPVYWARVPRMSGKAHQRSLGTTDKATALEICRFLEWLRGRREAWLLDELAAGRAKVGDAFDAYRANRLDSFIVELRDGKSDPNLEPYVARWQSELARLDKPNAQGRAKYLSQVRTLLPEGKPSPRSAFTKQRIRAWLEGLGIAQTNRHRAALSSFANYLVQEDVLATNPVLHVPAQRESSPRTVYLNQGEAKRLLGHLEGLHKRFHAFLMATGMEYGAAVKVYWPSDFQGRSVLAQGTKTSHRGRTCTVTDTWDWAWKVALEEMPSQGHPFKAVNYYAMRSALKAALEKAKLPKHYTTHDHRHTWAVQAIRDGLPLHVVAHQLGHRDSVMTLRVYGRFVPVSSDYGTRSATPSATSQTDAKAETHAK